MRQGTCSDCGLTATVRSFYDMNGKTFCEACVWKASREAKAAGRPAEYSALQDNSICARCGAYSGDRADHPLVGKLRLCTNCAPQVSDWPYPGWLKLSLATMILLLIVALIHGRHYFHAGRTMYVGERLVEEKQYQKAIPYLQETLRIAPESDKAVLLTAKAALEVGDMDTANKAIQGHDHGHFNDANDADFREVREIFGRGARAFVKAEDAEKLEQQDGHAAEAEKLMREAAAEYPEAKQLAALAENFEEGTAFEAKNYDRFLALAQKEWDQYPSSQTAGTVASALACKYAVTGDPKFREQAEHMLEVSKQKVGAYPDDAKLYQEYFERIEYRINSRQIITKAEYDRKFRSGDAQKGK